MAKAKIFRWKAIFPLLVGLVLLGVLWAVFGDYIVKQSSEDAATDLLGTEVDIGRLRVHESEAAVELSGLQVADPFDPNRNLLEAGSIRVDLDVAPLLEKKLIIERLSLQDLRFGTPRRKPARPVRGESFAGRTVRAVGEWRKKFDVPPLSLTPFDTIRQIVLNPEQLTSIREARALAARSDSVRTALTRGFDELALQPALDSARQVADRLAGADPKRLSVDGTRKAVEDVRGSLGLLKAARRRLDALQSSVSRGVGTLSSGAAAMDAAQERDVALAKGLLKLPSFSGPDLGSALFGPVSIDRFQQAVYWATVARKYMPPGMLPHEDPGPARLRRAGTSVRFPKRKAYPTFLLEQSDLSFTLAGKDGPLGSFQATMQGLTSQPAVFGMPTTIAARGAAGASAMRVNALINHLGERPRDSLGATLQNIRLPGFDLPGLPFRVEPGQGSSGLSFAMDGDRLYGRWTLRSESVQLIPTAVAAPGDKTAQLLGQVLAGLNRLELRAALGGTIAQPRLSVSSNLDQAITERVKGLIGDQAAKAEARVRAEVDRLSAEQTKAAKAKAAAVQTEVEGKVADARAQLDARQKELEARLKALTGGVGGLLKL